MTPPDCDLRGYEFMPLLGDRLFASEFFRLCRDDPWAFMAATRLWWAAWQQVPAGSLPSDDRTLAHLAEAFPKQWRRIRPLAMHGFVLCSDGRYYHPIIAELALAAYAKRGKERERKRRMRGGDAGQEPGRRHPGATQAPVRNPSGTASAPDRRAEINGNNGLGHVVPRDIPRTSRARERERELEDSPPTSPPPGGSGESESFKRFWNMYPKKVRRRAAALAWAAATRVTPPDDILAGLTVQVSLRRFDERDGGRYIPAPSDWLDDGRWLDGLELEIPDTDQPRH